MYVMNIIEGLPIVDKKYQVYHYAFEAKLSYFSYMAMKNYYFL